MSPAGRATSLSTSRRRAVGPSGGTVALYPTAGGAKSDAKLRRSGVSLAAETDLSARLRAQQRSLRSRVERRDALLEVFRAVSEPLNPLKVAELLVERAATWIPAPCWAVVGADLSGQQLSTLAERALEPDLSAAVNAIAAWVMHRGEPFLTADLRADNRIASDTVASVVAFPLICRGRSIGAVIGLDRRASSRPPRLAPAIQRGLGVLLEPASIALDNALILKRAEALSVTDDLTGLYNSRYLNQVLRRETKRALRGGRPLSVLFIDLDGFKAINDCHRDHMAGGRALVEAAVVIRGSARETDVVARFGGDEFALVLPDTGAEGAYMVGARIREKIAAHRFLADEGLDIHVTASVGVATLPDVATTAEELLQAADAAMYLVKDRGKNGIQAAPRPADN
jgi:diguanylate cyclase (GGDEF)-like protein